MNSIIFFVREECYDVLNKEIVDMILDVVERLKFFVMDEVEFVCLKIIFFIDLGKQLFGFFFYKFTLSCKNFRGDDIYIIKSVFI